VFRSASGRTSPCAAWRFAILRTLGRFTGDGTLRERENHIVIAAWRLLSPDEGTVFVDGVAVNGLSEAERNGCPVKRKSVCFPGLSAFHSLSAIDNVALGFELRDPALPGRMELARDLLVRFGLRREAQPRAIRTQSGGEAAGCHCTGPWPEIPPFFLRMNRQHRWMPRPEEASVNFSGVRLMTMGELLLW